jgi:hypothetical protein
MPTEKGRMMATTPVERRVYSPSDPDFWSIGVDLGEMFEENQVGGKAVGVELAFFLLGDDPEVLKNPAAVMFWMPPNYRLPRHSHACFRVEVIVKGSLDNGHRILKPGDVNISQPNQKYGPHLAGPEGCLTCEIFSDLRAFDPDMDEEDLTDQDRAMWAKGMAAIDEWKKAKQAQAAA